TLRGDAIRKHLWPSKFPELEQNLALPNEAGVIAPQFTVVLTNPPFGEDLKVTAADARASAYTITKAAAEETERSSSHVDLEIGLVYLELAHRLLQMG